MSGAGLRREEGSVRSRVVAGRLQRVHLRAGGREAAGWTRDGDGRDGGRP